jgi:phage-related protein
MAFDGSDPAWCLALPLAEHPTWRLRKAQFGDGYQQRILDGINALDRTFDISAEMKPASVLLEMDSYLTGREGAAFPFLDPATGETYSVFCDDWQIDWLVTRVINGVRQNLSGTLTATFEKANGITAAAIP